MQERLEEHRSGTGRTRGPFTSTQELPLTIHVVLNRRGLGRPLRFEGEDHIGYLWAGMALGACVLVALAAAVWPRLGHGGEGKITYFGHVARFEGLEELNAGLDKEASRHAFGPYSEATARAQP